MKIKISEMVVGLVSDEYIEITTTSKIQKKKSGYIKKQDNQYTVPLWFLDLDNEDYEIVSIDKLIFQHCSQDLYEEVVKPYRCLSKIPVNECHVIETYILDMSLYYPIVLKKFISKNHKEEFLRLPSECACEYLDCSNSRIEDSLPRLPNCKYIDCSYNKIKSFNTLPVCETLICNNNKIHFLYEMPKMKTLICNNNQLTYLTNPEYLRTIENFDCSNNKIVKMAALPNCINLNCSNNKLERLEALPNCINLNCSNNMIKRLPSLPNCVKLNCKENKNLTFLPNLPKVEEVDCSQTSIERFDVINKIVKKIILNNMLVKVKCDDVRRNHPQAEVICDSPTQPSLFKFVPQSYENIKIGDIPDTPDKRFSKMCVELQNNKDLELMQKLLSLYNSERNKSPVKQREKSPIKLTQKIPVKENNNIVKKKPSLMEKAIEIKKRNSINKVVEKMLEAKTDEDDLAEILYQLIDKISDVNVFDAVKEYKKRIKGDKKLNEILEQAWFNISDDDELYFSLEERDELTYLITSSN